MKRTPKTHRGQHGLGTLAIVIGLFLVMGLISAFAARTLMLEQRMAGQHYRGALADEMAEAGIDWAVALLNAGAIDNQCKPALQGQRFVDRYLTVSAANRRTEPKAPAGQWVVDCTRTAAGLECRCPAPGSRTPAAAAAAGADYTPSFALALGVDQPNPHLGSWIIESWGCTEAAADACQASAQTRSESALAVSRQRAAVGFVAAVPTPPNVPLTVRGHLTLKAGASLALQNTDPTGSGQLVLSGQSSPALDDSRLATRPGMTVAQGKRFSDGAVSALTVDRLFHRHLGWLPQRYRQHPALREVACPVTDCAAALHAAEAAGSRMLWVDGPLRWTGGGVLGTSAAPLVLVVAGDVHLTGPLQFNGLLVVLGDVHWSNLGPAPAQLNGMLLALGDMHLEGAAQLQWNGTIADALRNQVGSYVRVSGGWQDLETQ